MGGGIKCGHTGRKSEYFFPHSLKRTCPLFFVAKCRVMERNAVESEEYSQERKINCNLFPFPFILSSLHLMDGRTDGKRTGGGREGESRSHGKKRNVCVWTVNTERNWLFVFQREKKGKTFVTKRPIHNNKHTRGDAADRTTTVHLLWVREWGGGDGGHNKRQKESIVEKNY